ncbi:MAG: ZIP family metal transporter, partial [Planctomycetia bacterium]|nr:ZIP family metal transporter [Planctomycetia bacterium]
MFSSVFSFSPLTQTILAGLFTWWMTLLGAAMAIPGRTPRPKLNDAMLGAAGGVMIAAGFWSLLAPALELAGLEWSPRFVWIPVAIGFLAGAAAIRLLDLVLPHLHPGLSPDQTEGVPTHWRQSTLLLLAITIHNIPEGFAVGVAFGALANLSAGDPTGSLTFSGAWAVAIGIGLQNIPEGLAVAAPLRASGLSRTRAFMMGQLSGIVEPVAAIVGFLAVAHVTAILPYALAFAAGAMIFVVVE